jgi:hypothetical protein
LEQYEVIAACENKETNVFLMCLEQWKEKSNSTAFSDDRKIVAKCFRVCKLNQLLQACNETVF